VGRLGAVHAIVLFLGMFLVIGVVDFKILFNQNQNWNTVFLYTELITVFLITFAARYFQEEKDKKFIKGAFAKYVAPSIVDSILLDPTKLSLGGEKREMTIMFSDIRSFTTFSEKMDAKALAAFLNDYLGIMTKIVFANRGTLDKYIGDAVMAFWGAPLEDPEHATHACEAAAQMIKALADNRARFKSQYGIDVNIGVGINSGVVNVGNMGSDTNFEYTVIGDQVNLASRVEGITKEYGAEVITTKFTFDCIKKSGKDFPIHRILDDVKVKGKKNAVELIELNPVEYNAEGMKLFKEARVLYHAQKWDEAIAKFEAADRLLAKSSDTHDGPCETYLERCKNFKEVPPASDWDGSWKMETK
jgi:adenylate cyclase